MMQGWWWWSKKEDFRGPRKHLDFMFRVMSSSPPYRDEIWWGLTQWSSVLFHVDLASCKTEKGAAWVKGAWYFFLSLNYYFNAKIQQPRREGGQLYYGWPGGFLLLLTAMVSIILYLPSIVRLGTSVTITYCTLCHSHCWIHLCNTIIQGQLQHTTVDLLITFEDSMSKSIIFLNIL